MYRICTNGGICGTQDHKWLQASASVRIESNRLPPFTADGGPAILTRIEDRVWKQELAVVNPEAISALHFSAVSVAYSIESTK